MLNEDDSTPFQWLDSEIIPISAISHHLYCPRQNALIHTVGVFLDNDLTVSGNIAHEFVDDEKSISDHGVHKETSYRVFSEEYGLSGIADIIEFPSSGIPYPIDYKVGKIDSWINQSAQLCGVAFCLEEMFGIEVPYGAIYHVKSKRRREVSFDTELRNITRKAISEVRHNLVTNFVPLVVYSKICIRCSLVTVCQPKLNFKTNFPDIFSPVVLDG